MADTPQRLVVRASGSNASQGAETAEIGTSDTGAFGASDTAVAPATDAKTKTPAPTPSPLGTSLSESGPSTSAGTAQYPAEVELTGVTLSGRYLITRKVGQGGMGAVYEATHTLIGKRVAVKVLLEKYAKREAIVQRLEQEARLASSVGNEHIIDITDFGTTEDGRTFVVMEFLEGESLAECLARESKLPEQRILRVVQQAASALAAAHAKGVVHRDIKPENLFLLKRKDQDFLKVVDFGISKSLRASDAEGEVQRLTQTGMVLGTPLYMSPEQARGDDDLDHRVDVYALGVIMYEASTGQVPFSGSNYLSVISQVLNEDPVPPRQLRPELSDEFEAIVTRAMAKDRDDRYPNASDMSNDVAALIDDPTHSTERAKITGPRKKSSASRRNGLKILFWVAGIAVTIAAIVVTVVFTMGAEEKHADEKRNAAIVKDAGVALAPVVPPTSVVDAAPASPEAQTISIQIQSSPPGAEIFFEGRDWGATPTKVPFVVHDQQVELTAQLDGYDDQSFGLNPFIEKDRGEPILIKLHKPKAGAPKHRIDATKLTKPAGGTGSGSAVPAKGTTSELGGNPYGK